MRAERHEIVVVGGGIAGLYCCYQLARAGRRVLLCEASNRLGGRIETWRIDDELCAEFGPMRIEPKRQPLLDQLLGELAILEKPEAAAGRGDLVPFTGYRASAPRRPIFTLRGEEGEQKNILDLLRLGLKRLLERIQPLKWNHDAQRAFDGMVGRRQGRRPVRRTHWKRAFERWVQSLTESDFAELRTKGRFGDTPLWDMGFWNALSDVLSNEAVTKIRDWGSFYHLLPENPNAAEWMIFWLRAIQASPHLRGIKGGMDYIVRRLRSRLDRRDLLGRVRIERGMRLLVTGYRPARICPARGSA